MKRFSLKIGVLSLLVWMVGCQEAPRYFQGSRVLAEAAGEKLHMRDARTVVPAGVTGEDSVALMERYIDRWTMRQIKLREAEEYFSESEREIDSLVEEYRQSLLIRKFEQRLIEQQLDTAVTVDEMAEYYRNHQADFKLNRTVVKGRILRFGGNYRYPQKLKQLMTAQSESSRQDFADICAKNGFELTDLRNGWVDWNEFLSYLPIRRSESYDNLLQPGQIQQMSDARSHYYFEITEVLRSGEPEPLELLQEDIRRILLNGRQNQIIRENDERIYTRAREEGEVKVYAHEEIE